ncbi:MAG: hypothetical protein AAFX87_16620 [Bacteroidota bacterium]
MSKNKIFLAYLGSLMMLFSCDKKVHYLDTDYPGLTPELYAEGIINVEGRFQQNLTMSPDGKEYFITQTDSAIWRYERILQVKSSGEGQYELDTPQFVKDFKYENEWFIGEPMISHDNNSLFFVADFPPNLWQTKRTKNGGWSSPTKMPVSTEKGDWYAMTTKNGNLYFTNGIAYQCIPKNGEYLTKEKMDTPFNTKDVRDPVISPNEDYMIFALERPDGYGQSDLYVSFKDKQGNWSKAHILSVSINTEALEFAPYISPDEKFLFFSRRDQWQNAKYSNVYWVSLEAIEGYREATK